MLKKYIDLKSTPLLGSKSQWSRTHFIRGQGAVRRIIDEINLSALLKFSRRLVFIFALAVFPGV